MDVNGMDIIAFVIADGVYYVLLKNYTAGYFTGLGMYHNFIMKYGAIIAGVALIDLLMGHHDRIISNMVTIGLSGGVNKGLMYFMNPHAQLSGATNIPV